MAGPAEDKGIEGGHAGAGRARPDVPESRQVHLDVRDDIRRGQEPLARIMATVKELQPEMALVLRAPFEPVPLYKVLGTRGFTHWTERRAADDWSVWFYRATGGAAANAIAPEGRGAGAVAPAEPDGPEAAASTPRADGSGTAAHDAAGESRTLDVRGLEPPEPLVRILEAVEHMKPGDRLEILHERRPMFLYPQLEERGLRHETDEPAPGLVRIVVRCDAGAP